MKKAKLVIAIVALFAIIGGTLAFKTVKFNGRPLFTTTTLTIIGGTTYQTQVGRPPFCTFAGIFATAVGLPVMNPMTCTILTGDPSSTTLINTTFNQTLAIPYCRCISTNPVQGQLLN